MSIEAIFAQLEAGLKADPSVVKRVNGIYQFNIDVSGQKVSYVVDLKNGDGKITKGTGTADCVINTSEADFTAMMTGKANGQQLFLAGKLKIGGNMMLAMKLEELTKGMKKAESAAPAPAPAAAAAGGIAAAFAKIEANIKSNPDVAKKINGSYKFIIAGASGEETWIVDLKKPLVAKQAGEADCTISMKEEDFMALIAGKLDGQQAFMQGKLKLKGNMQLAMSLGSLVGQKAKL